MQRTEYNINSDPFLFEGKNTIHMRFGMENIKLMNKICEKLACLNVFAVGIHICLVVLQQFIILTKTDVDVEGDGIIL